MQNKVSQNLSNRLLISGIYSEIQPEDVFDGENLSDPPFKSMVNGLRIEEITWKKYSPKVFNSHNSSLVLDLKHGSATLHACQIIVRKVFDKAPWVIWNLQSDNKTNFTTSPESGRRIDICGSFLSLYRFDSAGAIAHYRQTLQHALTTNMQCTELKQLMRFIPKNISDLNISFSCAKTSYQTLWGMKLCQQFQILLFVFKFALSHKLVYFLLSWFEIKHEKD